MCDQNFHYGKTYLVTGAGRGIGKAVVAQLDNFGAKLYALSRNKDNLCKLKEEHPNVITICVDLSDWNATRGGKKARVSTQTVFYACTKAALEMLTKIMAITLGPHKIRINCVCPGIIETDMLKGVLEYIGENEGEKFVGEVCATMEQRTPSGVMVSPMSDNVNAILFMASNAATQVTGQSLDVDGVLSIA